LYIPSSALNWVKEKGEGGCLLRGDTAGETFHPRKGGAKGGGGGGVSNWEKRGKRKPKKKTTKKKKREHTPTTHQKMLEPTKRENPHPPPPTKKKEKRPVALMLREKLSLSPSGKEGKEGSFRRGRASLKLSIIIQKEGGEKG